MALQPRDSQVDRLYHGLTTIGFIAWVIGPGNF